MDGDVKELRELNKQAEDGWSENYEIARADMRMHAGHQWDEADARARRIAGRPMLTLNHLVQFTNQVENDFRMNRPAIKISPVDDEADLETAEVLQGLIRNIEVQSRADIAYDTAMSNATRCGIGWIRIDHDYVGPSSFDQELVIRRVANPLSAYIDPTSTEPDGSDAAFGFIYDDISKAAFKAQFPDADADSVDSSERATGWLAENTVRVCEMFKIEETPRKLYLTDMGRVTLDPKLVMPGETIIRERTAMMREVKRYKYSASEILESTVFPTSEWGVFIPLVPVFGQESWVDNRRYFKSLHHNAHDAQRMYNAWASYETEVLAMSPKVPWMVDAGAIAGFEDVWKNPDSNRLLIYNSTDGTNVYQRPDRVAPPSTPTGIINARLSANDDMKATIGMYDASLGQRSNEQSGRAILARQREGDMATFHFIDNASRSIRQVGRVLLSAIPKVYDTPRMMRILGDDMTPAMVAVNGMQPSEESKEYAGVYDLNMGRYDATVSVGPSFTTKRQEAAESMMALAQANPQISAIAGDLMVKAMDWPGADEIAERLKRAIPPEIRGQDDEDVNGGEGGPVDPLQSPAVMQLADQARSVIQQQQDAIAQLQAQLDTKAAEVQMQAAKLEIERMKAETDRIKVMGDLKLREDQTQLSALSAMSSMRQQPTEADLAGMQAQIAQLQGALDVLLRESEQPEMPEGPETIISINS